MEGWQEIYFLLLVLCFSALTQLVSPQLHLVLTFGNTTGSFLPVGFWVFSLVAVCHRASETSTQGFIKNPRENHSFLEKKQKDRQKIPGHFNWEQMLGNGKGMLLLTG